VHTTILQIPWKRHAQDIILARMSSHTQRSRPIVFARFGKCPVLVIQGILLAGFVISGAALPLPGVIPLQADPAPGALEVSFLFNKAEGVVPSYQIAI